MTRKKYVLKSIAMMITLIMLSAFIPKFNTEAAGYDPSAAVAYAEKYWKNYNPNYPNYNGPNSGDCANFVSQCLYAGGLQMTDGWFFYSDSNRSPSWTFCSNMYEYFKNAGYTIIENPSDSQVIKGNPVLYDWYGSGWGHAAICIGNNSNGVPLVAAHNADCYGHNLDMGAYKTCTILINKGGVTPTPPDNPNPKVKLPAFEIGDTVNITWDNIENVDSYWLHIYRNGEDYVNKSVGMSLSYSEKFPVGNYTAYVVPYNSFGETISYVDFSVYDSKPQYAKVELKLNAYEVGDDVTFYLSSDTGNNYTVGIDNANGKRIDTFNTEIGENTYTRKFNTPGQYSCYISTYNNLGQADSERIYFSIYDSKPKYAKVELKLNAYEVGDDVTFYLSSDTGNNYTVGIDDANGKRIDTFNTEIGENTYTRKFNTPGQYSCYISTYNNLGQADSERIYFSIYDSKPKYAKVELKLNAYEVGDDVTFYLSSDTGVKYTVGIDDANGKRIDTFTTDFGENTYTRKFDTPGQYSCYITTYNNIGLADSERIYFTIYYKGDTNNDGSVTIADLVTLQSYILGKSDKLECWQNSDLCEDGVIDSFDLAMLRRLLIKQAK